jgi:hypothetical protein
MQYYRQDPIFKVWNQSEGWCHHTASKYHVQCYLIDVILIDEWINAGCKPVVTNSIISPNPEMVFQTNNSLYGVYYHPYSLEVPKSPTKKYNCFINRMDPVRQSWLYQLIRRNIFNQGYVSFNMDISRIPYLNGIDTMTAFEQQFKNVLSIFKPEHDVIKSQVPYRNFSATGDLTEVILDSEFSIVLETHFDNNNIITFSEKIFRALQMPQPWVLFAHQHAVRHLKDMGFDVLDDVVPHNMYDGIEFDIDRQVAILDVVQLLLEKEINSERVKHAANHNQQLMKQFAKTWQDDFIECVEKAAKYV